MPDLKRLITHFTYRIEKKSDGSFIAHATDPTLPPLEAPTRLELQQKIQQNVNAALMAEFPGLNLASDHQQLKAAFHIERTPDGSFTIHSSDPTSGPMEAAPHEIESKFAEKLIGYMGKHVLSNLSPELASQITNGDIKVFVTRAGLGGASALPSDAGDSTMLKLESAAAARFGFNASSATGSAATQPAQFSNNAGESPATGALSYSGDNSPIHRTQPNSGWGLLRFLFALLFLGAIIYFYLRFR
jgi:hypothetical protein